MAPESALEVRIPKTWSASLWARVQQIQRSALLESWYNINRVAIASFRDTAIFVNTKQMMLLTEWVSECPTAPPPSLRKDCPQW